MKKVIGIIVIVIVVVTLAGLFISKLNQPRYITTGVVTLSDGREVNLDELNENVHLYYDTKTEQITISYSIPTMVSGESE